MKRIVVNYETCMGCGLCAVHCLTAHSSSKDIVKAHKAEKPHPLARVRVERKGDVCFAVQCRHCVEPWCARVCPTGAMARDPATGIVAVDRERCAGCWTCMLACPYGALLRDKELRVAVKCDLCLGRSVPACVEACPNRALQVIEVNASVAQPEKAAAR